jgi:class 3 adenylate cyclase
MSSVVLTGSAELGSSPEDVWRYVSDTDRTNRAIGANAVDYAPVEEGAPTSARFVATTSAGGFAMTYEELPFEWSHARDLRVVRKMRGGLLESYEMRWGLAPSKTMIGGTHVTVTLELRPRIGLLTPVARLQGAGFVRKLIAFAESIDTHVRDRGPSPFAMESATVDERLLADGVASLVKSGVRPELAQRIAGHLRTAGDADVVRIRPFELADALSEDRREVLRAMLHGVPAGLFELRWALVCPSCLQASGVATSLDQISPEGHCQLCDIHYELDLDRAVEATFVPHEAVRKVPPRMFCMGGPARTPHVWSQTNLDPGGERPLEAPSDAGRCRVFARGGATVSVEVDPAAPREARVAFTDAGARPGELRVAPGGSIVVTNETREPRHVKVERLAYASNAATAHLLSTVDEFRRLFSRDLLKRGTPLRVARVAILFSDLTGSTALYTKVGDAAAFRLVDDHFDVMRAAIAKHEGVVVKTMGDAVLAAFRDPHACVAAAADALRAFEEFRRGREHGDLVGLKLGAFAGACYVVTANGVLDYFGQTVNVASRVQHLAGSGEILLPRDLFDALEDEERAALRVTERLEARVKGVEHPLDLIRVTLAPMPRERSHPSRIEAPGEEAR